MRSSFGSLIRLARAGFVLARAGVFSDVDPSILPPAARLPLALAELLAGPGARTAGAKGAGKKPRSCQSSRRISRLGPSYVKLGQFLATRPDVVGAAIVQHLERLQDRMAPFPRRCRSDDRGRLRRTARVACFEVSESRSPPPRLRQVHRAAVETAGGARRRRQGAASGRRALPRDLGDMYFAALLPNAVGEARRSASSRSSIRCPHRQDGNGFPSRSRRASEFAENTKDDTDLRIPTIDWDRTTKEVLTFEWIDGTPLSDIKALAFGERL